MGQALCFSVPLFASASFLCASNWRIIYVFLVSDIAFYDHFPCCTAIWARIHVQISCVVPGVVSLLSLADGCWLSSETYSSPIPGTYKCKSLFKMPINFTMGSRSRYFIECVSRTRRYRCLVFCRWVRDLTCCEFSTKSTCSRVCGGCQ